jgi:hypothetical protein
VRTIILGLLTTFAASAACFPVINPFGRADRIICVPGATLSAVTGATANSVLFANPAGLLTSTPSLIGYNSSTQIFTLGTNQFTSETSGVTTLTLRGVTGQTGNLMAFRNVGGSTLSIIDSGGAFASYTGGVQKVWHGSSEIVFANDSSVSFKDNSDASLGTIDLRLSRDSAETLKVTTGAGALADIRVRKYLGGTDQLTFDTSSNKTILTIKGGSSQSTDTYLFVRDPSNNLLSVIDAGGGFASYLSNVQKIWHGQKILTLSSDASIGWKDNVDSSAGTVDIKLMRDSANWLKIVQSNESTLANLKVGQVQVGTSGTGVIDFVLGTVPTSPAAGQIALWADTATSRFKGVDSSGTQFDLGGGTTTSIGEWSSTLDFPSIVDLGCGDLTFTATDAPSGLPLIVVPPAIGAGIQVNAWVSASNTVKVRVCNFSGADADLGSATFTVKTARGFLSGSDTIDFGSICAGCTLTSNVTRTGATTAMAALVHPPAALSTGLFVSARVSASNTITISLFNATEADLDPASGSFTASAVQ